MDEQRFDGMARRFATETSRRRMLCGLAAGVAGSLMAVRGRAAPGADCARFCRQLPPGRARGQCVSESRAGTGLCFRCGPAASDQTQQLCEGVCVDTGTDARHCGTCGAVCASGQICDSGTCVTPCAPGETACNGACVSISTDPNNCGACGTHCAFANAGAACDQGVCTLGTCAAGWGNCDADSADGCETDLTGDLNNCGGCGVVCPTPANATATCADGTCGISCTQGFTACGGVCADLQSDAGHCGACDSPCPDGATCSSGSCVCPPEMPDVCPYSVGGVAGSRCVDIQSDEDNCGACRTRCSTQQCRGGRCRGSAGQTCYDLDYAPGDEFCYTGQCINTADGTECTDPTGTVETCVCA